MRISSLDDVIRLLQHYAEIRVPREPADLFSQHLTKRKDAWFVEAGDYGLIYLTNIIPGFVGHLQVLFWDQKLPEARKKLVQAVVSEAIRLFALRRVQAVVYVKPERRKKMAKSPLYRFLIDIGFSYEGTLRHSYVWDGELVDTAVLSVLREEATWPLPTTSLG